MFGVLTGSVRGSGAGMATNQERAAGGGRRRTGSWMQSAGSADREEPMTLRRVDPIGGSGQWVNPTRTSR